MNLRAFEFYNSLLSEWLGEVCRNGFCAEFVCSFLDAFKNILQFDLDHFKAANLRRRSAGVPGYLNWIRVVFHDLS